MNGHVSNAAEERQTHADWVHLAQQSHRYVCQVVRVQDSALAGLRFRPSPPGCARVFDKFEHMRTCVRVRVQPPKDPSCRLVLLMDTSLPPKPKVAAAGRFSHAGGRASGVATPERPQRRHASLRGCFKIWVQGLGVLGQPYIVTLKITGVELTAAKQNIRHGTRWLEHCTMDTSFTCTNLPGYQRH